MLWSSLLLYAMLLGFLGTVNSSSSVKVDHFRFNKLTSVFLCVCPVIDHKFHHHIVKVAVDPRGDSREVPQTTLTML